MAIDKARLHKLHLESRALLDSLADRLPSERMQRLRTFSDVGEWGLLVNGLCASLVKGQLPITPGERDALASVLALFRTPSDDLRYVYHRDETLAALNVVE
jgi:hypothetical protein